MGRITVLNVNNTQVRRWKQEKDFLSPQPLVSLQLGGWDLIQLMLLLSPSLVHSRGKGRKFPIFMVVFCFPLVWWICLFVMGFQLMLQCFHVRWNEKRYVMVFLLILVVSMWFIHFCSSCSSRGKWKFYIWLFFSFEERHFKFL